jgi:hypothetical protein
MPLRLSQAIAVVGSCILRYSISTPRVYRSCKYGRCVNSPLPVFVLSLTYHCIMKLRYCS